MARPKKIPYTRIVAELDEYHSGKFKDLCNHYGTTQSVILRRMISLWVTDPIFRQVVRNGTQDYLKLSALNDEDILNMLSAPNYKVIPVDKKSFGKD
jgi:hypothetical protein